MSRYYECTDQSVSFARVKQDIADGKIEGIKIDIGNESNTDDMVCITDGTNYVWLMPSCVTEFGCGMKRWGGNDVTTILETLENYYDRPFTDEEDLGIMHIG